MHLNDLMIPCKQVPGESGKVSSSYNRKRPLAEPGSGTSWSEGKMKKKEYRETSKDGTKHKLQERQTKQQVTNTITSRSRPIEDF